MMNTSSAFLWLKPAWRQYALAFAVFVVVSVFNLWLQNWIGYQAIALVYLLAVVIIALFIDRGPTIFCTVLTAAGWNYFFAPPPFAFNISDTYDNMMLIAYFVVTLTVGHLTTQLRAQRTVEMERGARASALYQLTGELAAAKDIDDIFCTVIRQIGNIFKMEVALLLPNAHSPLALSPYTASKWSPGEKEQAFIAKAFARNQAVGRGTEFYVEAEGFYLPLSAGDTPAAVLALRWKRKSNALTVPQHSLLDDFVRQISVAWDRQRLRDVEMDNKFLAESERLGRTLLNSISHELRTPIAAITSAASGLHSSDNLSPAQKSLASEIESASARLNRLVQSLLSAARLQAGQIRPKLDWCDVSDLVQVTLRDLEGMLTGHPIAIQITSGLPLIKVDFVLMEQVLSNLLFNTVAHTPPGTPVEINARTEEGAIVLEVADRGPGLPSDQLSRIFDLFHRAPDARPGGTGLGLAIVKGFVEAQGGRVQAANRPDGGAIFTIRLPVKEKPILPEENL